MRDEARFIRALASKLREAPVGFYRDAELADDIRRLEHMANDLDRIPTEPIKLDLPGGLVLTTKEAVFFEDLPWDAYVRKDDASVWADGMTEIEAFKKVIQRARAIGWLPAQ